MAECSSWGHWPVLLPVIRAVLGPCHDCQLWVPGLPLPDFLCCSVIKFVGSTASIDGFELQLFHCLWDVEEVTSSLHASHSSFGK